MKQKISIKCNEISMDSTMALAWRQYEKLEALVKSHSALHDLLRPQPVIK